MRNLLAGFLLLCLTFTASAQAPDSIRACLPLARLQMTSPFGYRVHPVTGLGQFHNGVDLRAHSDTVFSIMDGVVLQTGYDELLGIYIRIAHNDGLQTLYGHLSITLVIAGETVSTGEMIAISGNTGRTTGGHLHFSIIYQQHPIDPLKFLSGLLQTH